MRGAREMHYTDTRIFKTSVQISNTTHVQKAAELRSYQPDFLYDDGAPKIWGMQTYIYIYVTCMYCGLTSPRQPHYTLINCIMKNETYSAYTK